MTWFRRALYHFNKVEFEIRVPNSCIMPRKASLLNKCAIVSHPIAFVIQFYLTLVHDGKPKTRKITI